MHEVRASPFLKAVGGKAGVLPALAPYLPAPGQITGYREPFIGGGALFFLRYAEVRPALVADLNWRLIDAYIAVRDHVEELLIALDEEQPLYSEAHFYAVRDQLNSESQRARFLSLVERAVGVFVISKWGFNGLWRENPRGGINTSFGKPSKPGGPPPRLCDRDSLRACSAALAGVDVRAGYFDEQLDDLRPRELVLFDPPYVPVSDTADFTAYTADGFTYGDAAQVDLFGAATLSDGARLALAMQRVDNAGAYFAMTNSAAAEPFFPGWAHVTYQAGRSVNSKGGKRGPVDELLFRNFEVDAHGTVVRRGRSAGSVGASLVTP